MTPVNAIVRNGKIEIATPDELVDGTEVRVWLDVATPDDEPMSQDEIARTLAAMANVERLEISKQESQLWQASLDQQKAYEASSFENRLAKLLSHWK